MSKTTINARIVSPSRSGEILSKETVNTAIDTLKTIGVNCSFGKHYVHTQTTTKRELILIKGKDINDAYADSSIDLIFSAIGGHNTIRVLEHLDWDVITANPKPICGFSDITVLLNAIHAVTGHTTYLGPHFSTFGMKKGLEYTIQYFDQAVLQRVSYELIASKMWSDDPWFIDQDNRAFYSNEGPVIVNDGCCKGKIIGGNLSVLNLLQGTRYMPDLKDAVLFIEDDDLLGDCTLREFEQNLQSLLSQAATPRIAGLLVGRFQTRSNVNLNDLTDVLRSFDQLEDCPVICNLDFGHTTPMFTIPIGGTCHISTEGNKVGIRIKNAGDN